MFGVSDLAHNSLLSKDMPVIWCGPIFAPCISGANPCALRTPERELPKKKKKKKKGTKHSCNVAPGLRF